MHNPMYRIELSAAWYNFRANWLTLNGALLLFVLVTPGTASHNLQH